jgi:hypothetical protein
MPTEGSGIEDFRGVIDDLTVANKKLKQRLRKYERSHDAHLQDQKLFEVRFHGLPDHKKKELEETLRQFALGLNEDPPSTDTPAGLEIQHSNISRPTNTESGYVSMSASGQHSTSAPSGREGDNRKMSKSQYQRQQQSVQSYLYDTPAALLARPSASMSESSRKKLVVRRLEQVFAGKVPTPGNHQQPEQQEEVAQSAALADRKAREASGRRTKEGIREALIMPTPLEEEDAIAGGPHPSMQTSEQDTTGSGSPDQRPTRPLDLDPARAQVPADNLEYIRHLGFRLPDTMSGEPPQDGNGWVYLNLLINMAQLHTINVTPDFVKDALTEYSTKFELSADGRKVRWKGGNELTLNSDSSSEHLSGSSRSPSGGMAGSNSRSSHSGLKTDHNTGSTDSVELERQARRAARAAKERERSRFSYTPLFFHKQDSDDEDEIFNSSSDNSPLPGQQPAHTSALASSGVRSSSSRKRSDNGPLIFYNQANFCTDLSGQRGDLAMPMPKSTYQSISTEPMGAEPNPKTGPRSGISEPRGPMDLDPKEGEIQVTSSEDDVAFSLPDLRRNDSSDGSASVMEFEASGVGGVQPEDNFAIRVKRSQMRGGPSSVTGYKSGKQRMYPAKILEALKEQQSEGGQSHTSSSIRERIVSTSRKTLPNSTLPPPSYLPFDSTSSGDVDSDLDDSDVSSSPSTLSSSGSGPGPAMTPEHHHVSPMHPSLYAHDNQAGPSSEDVSSSGASSSFDYTGRVALSDIVDAELADIPAGSSAATAGGGSGNNSPVNMDTLAHSQGSTHKMQQQMRATGSASLSPGSSLKRARTSDSITLGQQEPAKSQRLN